MSPAQRRRRNEQHRARWGHVPCPACGRETNGRGICWREDDGRGFCGWRPWRPVSKIN